MRGCFSAILVALFAMGASAQQVSSSSTASPSSTAGKDAKTGSSAFETMFEAKIKDEWEAIKNKDQKAYRELLADDYQGVEVDGQGERNKIQAIAEIPGDNISNYTLWGFRVTPLGPDAAFVIYEVTQQFPPRSQIRFSRVYVGELWVKRDGKWKELHYQETHVK